MIEHIKKLFIAMIAISCFTCFQRADYNLPMFAFAFFLWDYKRPNVIFFSIIVPERKAILFILFHLDCRLCLAHLLGRDLEF